MATLRQIKKDINGLTFWMLAEITALYNKNNGLAATEYDSLVRKIIYFRNDLILRVNHPESDAESKSIPEHYRKIKEDLYLISEEVRQIKQKFS